MDSLELVIRLETAGGGKIRDRRVSDGEGRLLPEDVTRIATGFYESLLTSKMHTKDTM